MRLRNFWITVAIMFLMPTIFPLTQAAPVAVIYEIEVEASPAVQRIGAPIDIECEVGFGGACCYTVYAHDVKAEILLPENVTLVSGNRIEDLTSPGRSSGTVAVDPGGELTWLHQSWSIKAEEYGEYNVTIYITGENEGGDELNESENVKIVSTSGAAISKPILTRNPALKDEIIIVAGVSTLESNVENVTLYYSRNQENWISLPMENTDGEMWMGIIPGQNSEGEVYYYMESLTTDGETFTTQIYQLQVKDTAKIGIIKFLATYGTLAAFIAGIGLIFFISRKGKAFSSRKGLTILGASLKLSALRSLGDIKDDQDRLRKLRKWIALALLMAAIVLLIFAVITGQLQDVISHTTNPTEG